MPRTQSPSPRPSNQKWLSVALVGISAIFILAGVVMLVGGEPSGALDFRAISRSLIVGAALGAYGVWRLLSAGNDSAGGEKGAGAPQPPSGAQGRPSAAAELDGMLLHSDDVLATLRDIVSHGSRGSFGAVPELLSKTGLMSWHDAPKDLRVSRLSRSGRWWLHMGADLDEKDYDRLTCVEAALNLADDVARGRGADAREALAHVASIEPRPYDGTYAIGKIVGSTQDRGEWQMRTRLADYLENLPLPFRADFDLQANAAEGLLCAEVDCPRPACFAPVCDGNASQAGEARAYALRLALLVARGAIEAAGAKRAVVSCHEHSGEDPVLSVDVTREALARLLSLAASPELAGGPLPTDPALRASERADGWLGSIEPFLRLDSPDLCPEERFREIELDHAPAGEELQKACGARLLSDLGINEKAPRVHAWNSLVAELGETTQEAVSKLVDVRDSAKDVTVAEACDRASKALVEGTLDVSNKHELAILFVDGSALAQALRHAERAVGPEGPTADDLTSAVAELEQALSPITEMGIYLDDPATVYRYFNSAAERVIYNRTVDDGKRKVQLVPDEYYSAHSMAARYLNMLGRSDEALVHAQEIVRVAPVTTDAKLGMVRCLEEQSRIFEAADLLKETIGQAATMRDLSVCFYRLAYMEWKLGREDLAVACYQRAIQLHPDIVQQAREELQDLLSANKDLKELPDEQVVPALEAADIPAGPVDELRSVLLAAASACVDANVFSIARPLLGALAEIGRDDVIIDVHRSLTRP